MIFYRGVLLKRGPYLRNLLAVHKSTLRARQVHGPLCTPFQNRQIHSYLALPPSPTNETSALDIAITSFAKLCDLCLFPKVGITSLLPMMLSEDTL